MKKQLEDRLQELKSEYESGRKMMADYEAKQADLQKTLLRIEGAIQVLTEELEKSESEPKEAEVVDAIASVGPDDANADEKASPSI